MALELYLMFRFVVITFEILALIMILRSGLVQFWLSDIQTSTTQWIHGVSMTMDNQQLAKFRNDISDHVQNLTDTQTASLYKITSTKTELNNLNLHYSHAGDKNPYIYCTHLRHVCGEIIRNGMLDKFS